MPLHWEDCKITPKRVEAVLGDIEFGYICPVLDRQQTITKWKWETGFPGTDKLNYSMTEEATQASNTDGLRFYRGYCDTKEQAQAALVLKYQEWLADAGLSDLNDEERQAVEAVRKNRANQTELDEAIADGLEIRRVTDRGELYYQGSYEGKVFAWLKDTPDDVVRAFRKDIKPKET